MASLLRKSDAHDAASRSGKLGQALAIHAVVHERAVPLGKNKTSIAQDLQVMRNGGLANGKMLDDVANANRLSVCGQQIQNADTRGVGKRLEPARVFCGVRAGELGSSRSGTSEP